ncbi:HAMP domain-containing sensor histidine kinase [Psychrobacillus sp. FSL K6-2684]|uniref:sensor histidine kinase n=1 Tax=unclassified Psychrobacillus TaxID=2636677 RepID=UPI0012478C68|nr:HAMP domain-containing sensor histidine kinase [Psychrobacillus sp. AK 1817]QEY21020.1 sensor histidine kinase [Psychrobacillus sp. AK 1817]
MKSLYRQYTLATLFIITISILAGLLIVSLVYNIQIKEKNDEKNVEVAVEITTVLEKMHGRGFDKYLESITKLGYQAYVINEKGEEYSFGEPFSDKELSDETRFQVLNGNIYHGMRDYQGKLFIFNHYANSVSNTVGIPYEHEGMVYGLFIRPNNQLLFSDMHLLLLGFLLALAVIILVSMLVLAQQLVKPIKQLNDATKHVMEENYRVDLDITRKDELGQLARNFSNMVKQLELNDESRKAFISNVSHDFQSPLLNIQGYADLLKSTDLNMEERESYLQVIEQETKRLSNLTKQLLLLTSLDQSARPVRKSNFRLDEQLKEVIYKYRWRLEEQNIDLSYEMEPVMFYGDADLLENVWDNVLTNAIKYNIANGEISIRVTEDNEYVNISFQDSGIGMEVEEINQIFERFYRIDSSRTKDGSGLGLAIVKEIVDLHSGKVEVTSNGKEGTLFVISLPRN